MKNHWIQSKLKKDVNLIKNYLMSKGYVVNRCGLITSGHPEYEHLRECLYVWNSSTSIWLFSLHDYGTHWKSYVIRKDGKNGKFTRMPKLGTIYFWEKLDYFVKYAEKSPMCVR